MKRRTIFFSIIGVFIATIPFISSAQDGSELAAKLADGIEDGNSLTRLRMIIKSGSGKTTLNMQIKSRRSGSRSDVLYQVIFPADRKGESVLLSQKGKSAASGYAYKPPAETANPLRAADLGDSVFGSDLSYQDLIENFFRWKTQAIAGNETVGRTDCVILESRPGSNDATPYSLVKSWVDPEKLVTMKVEKYDKAGKLVREIETLQVAKNDKGRHIPAKLLVRRPGTGSETELDGSNIRHDVEYSDETFTPRAMATLR